MLIYIIAGLDWILGYTTEGVTEYVRHFGAIVFADLSEVIFLTFIGPFIVRIF
jgi:hypothetical protein